MYKMVGLEKVYIYQYRIYIFEAGSRRYERELTRPKDTKHTQRWAQKELGSDLTRDYFVSQSPLKNTLTIPVNGAKTQTHA